MRSAEVRAGLPPSPPLPGALQTWLMWRWPFSFLSAMRRRYGPRFTLHALARPPLVFLSDLSEAKEVFAASPELLPGEGGATIMPIVGEQSFMLADGEVHWRGRTMLSPAFSQRAIDEHAETVRDLAEREIAAWPRGVPLPLHDRLRALTLRVILHALFGHDVERVPDLHGRLLSMLALTAGTGLTLPASRSLLPGGRASWRQFLADRAAVDAMLLHLVEARRERPGDQSNVLTALIAARDAGGHTLPADYVRDSLMSLILAGHETTAAELCWAFQLLAHHPRVQDRLAAELAAGDRVYLTATVIEVLRHRPVFLFAIPRAVAAPIAIGGWTYEPPAQLLVCIYLLHHDPVAFPSPDEFRPERFLDDHPGASWLPWGGGRKRCPGRRLALLELETVLAAALSTVSVHPAAAAPERPRWRSVIVTPHAGSQVVVRDRRTRARPVG